MTDNSETLGKLPISRRTAIAALGAMAAASAARVSAAPMVGGASDLTWLPAWRLRELIVGGQVSA